MDKDTIEGIRKWGALIFVIGIYPITGLYTRANNLQLMKDISDNYVHKGTYAGDVGNLSADLKSVVIKVDTILVNQAVDQERSKAFDERLKAIEIRLEGKK